MKKETKNYRDEPDLVLNAVNDALACFSKCPLSLTQFMNKSTMTDAIYPHIWAAWHQLQKHTSKHTYISGCIGSGKATFYNGLFLYKVYLWTLLKSPSKYFGHNSQVEYSFGIICNKKTGKMVVESLIHQMVNLPEFFESYSNKMVQDPSKIYYSIAPEEDILIRFYYYSSDFTELKYLNVYAIWTDISILLGKNLITTLCTEITGLLEFIGEEELWSIVRKATDRIDARTHDELFVSGMIMEKSPVDYEKSIFDKWANDTMLDNKKYSHINFAPYWSLFPDQVTTKEVAYLDLADEEFYSEPTNQSVKVPLNFKEKYEEMDRQTFIRDFLGAPTSKVMNPIKRKIQNIIDEMRREDITIIMEHGKFYFKDRFTNNKCDIQDLF